MKSYLQIFKKEYWVGALSFLKETKKLVFLSLLMALMIVLDSSMLSIPLIPGELEIRFSFIVAATIGFVFGPIAGVMSGGIVDVISYSISGSKYPFFIGYTLGSCLSGAIYGLILYRQRINIVRLFTVKMLINGIINVFLGTVWMEILNPGSKAIYFTQRLIKNAVLLPYESYILFIIFVALIPHLKRGYIIPEDTEIGFL